LTGILVVSDLHYKHGYHRNIYEGDALNWLLKILDAHKPTDLIIAGDSDDGWSLEDWSNLTDKVHVSAIAGNHENLPLLQSAKNHDDDSRVWCKDGEARDIQGLKFGFINYIMALNEKRIKEGVPRKTPEAFWRHANELKGVQVLVTHESPWDESYGTRIHRAAGCDTVRAILEANQYPIALSGHLSGPFTVTRIGKTISIRVDSSPHEKVYAILQKESNVVSVQIYHDLEPVEAFAVPLP